MKEKLQEMVFHLENRPKMYLLGHTTYATFVCFLIGFGEGAKENERNILSEFDDWLQAKVGKKFSLHWSSYILEEICRRDEEKAKMELLRLLAGFCNES